MFRVRSLRFLTPCLTAHQRTLRLVRLTSVDFSVGFSSSWLLNMKRSPPMCWSHGMYRFVIAPSAPYNAQQRRCAPNRAGLQAKPSGKYCSSISSNFVIQNYSKEFAVVLYDAYSKSVVAARFYRIFLISLPHWRRRAYTSRLICLLCQQTWTVKVDG